MVALSSNVTPEDAAQFESWLQSISSGRSHKEVDFIRSACQLAQAAHQGQSRASGEPFFLHSLAVANILADLRLDHETIAAAVLHDVPEDTEVTIDEICQQFGSKVAKLVDGVTKMTQIQEYHGQTEQARKEKAQAETFRKMMLAMVDDIRVVLIKLADRTHNMRTLSHLPEEKRRRIARETLDIFAPLANRLGIWQIKWELEDRSFSHLEPEIYKQIAGMVDERRILRERYIKKVCKMLEGELKKNGIEANIVGRSKHIYSIWRKMKRKGLNFDKIYDVRAVRVLVKEVSDCYATLGIVHTKWSPVQGEFDDYIAAPKDNMYRSLHTAVIGPDGKTLEVQIRTLEMHQHAEYGVAAHWKYKEGRKSDTVFDQKIAWFRQLLEWEEEVADANTFVNNVKNEVFQDRVHVFTPKGKIVDLPYGATSIDFAYYIHTEVGHRCRGAKVDGRIVPLTYRLKNGDQVEVLTAKRGGPSRDWLNVHLGYLKTARARTKARQWFKKQAREENIVQGRHTLERELNRLGLPRSNYDKLAHTLNYNRVEDFLASIGHGDLTLPQIIGAIKEVFAEYLPKRKEAEPTLLEQSSRELVDHHPTGIKVQGVGKMMTTLAKCCRPVPGDDDIIGYITKGRGATIHRKDCPNVLHLSKEASERLIEVTWEAESDTVYPVDIEIEAFDRPGLLRDITNVVDKINLVSANVITDKKKHRARVFATLEIRNLDQLSRVLAILEQLPNVTKAQRRL